VRLATGSMLMAVVQMAAAARRQQVVAVQSRQVL
jgi:hypothetical protein